MYCIMLFVFSLQTWAQQQKKISGTVSSSDNSPIIGANIIIKGSPGQGTITDVAGNYTLQVAEGQTLIVSFVGMESQEITVGQDNVINVVLSDGLELDQVVVIGYGSVKKSHLTGAVSSVSGKALQANVARSTANALQGRIAGVSVSSMGGQPGDGMNINIRGISSLGSNTPLFIIDGVYADINLVDPADIASMEILKDASAAAIYGSRAANGVVLITTKAGTKGTPIKVDVNAFAGMQSVVKRLDMMNANQWIQTIKPTFPDQNNLPATITKWNGSQGTDWQDEMFRTAPIVKANITLSGGSDKATYNLSAGLLNQDGVLIKSGYQAFNLRSRNTFNLFNDHVRLGNTLILKDSEKKKNNVTVTDILWINPLIPVRNESQLGGFGAREAWMRNMDNPVGYSHLYDNKEFRLEMMLNAFAEVDLFVPGLYYKLNLGYNKNNGRNYNYNSPYDFGSGVIKSNINELALYSDQWLVENTLNYNKSFGKHDVSGLLGYSAQKNTYRNFGAGRQDLPAGTYVIGAGSTTSQITSGELQENSIVSLFGRAMYSYDNRYLFSASVRRDGSSRFADGHRYGVFPSISAGWNIANESFFESARNIFDELKVRASYGELGNQEIGNYATQNTVSSGINYVQGGQWWMGSITGAKWVSPGNLTWEKTVTSNFGLDASLWKGKLSVNFDTYVQNTKDILLAISMPQSVGMSGSPTMNAGTIENRGVELSLNHRNQIGEFSYNIGVNIATVQNEIKEVTVGNIQRFGGYNPQGEGTITWAMVGDPIGAFYLIKTDGIFQSQAEINAHVDANGNLLQPKAAPGDIKFLPNLEERAKTGKNGEITDNDRQYAGSPFPDFTFGIRAGARWRGFDVDMFFDGMQGNKIYNFTRARLESSNLYTNYSTRLLDSWTPQNTNTEIPRFIMSDPNLNSRRVSDRWLEDGSFLRLKTLELGYTVPSNITKVAKIENLRIYTAMENLFTITKYKGFTPDLGESNGQNGGTTGTMTRGTDHGRFPLARTISLGVQLVF